ncbi:MAG: diguanylate cyclase domain-containing protein, partial [Pseudomonas sp.]
LLSLALADRINIIQRKQEAAQQEALVVNRRMVEALRENEHLLESRVQERTQALKEANSQLQLSKQLLERQANHDALTGLANRKLLSDRLDGALRRAQRNGSGFTLMMIDLDRFKSINDSLGHQAGDQVLVEVAKRLKATLRDIDTVARVGGDEFVLVLESTTTRPAVTVVRQKLLRQVLRPIRLASGEQVSIGMSVGAALYPEDAQDIELLFSLADKEMYSSKPLQFPS